MELIAHAYVLFAHTTDTITGIAAPLQGLIPNPAPKDPTDGSEAVSLFFAILKWGVAICAAVGALGSLALIGVGKLADNPSTMSKGKAGLPWAVVAVIGAAIVIPLLNTVQSSV
jgi:hypothetical protein